MRDFYFPQFLTATLLALRLWSEANKTQWRALNATV